LEEDGILDLDVEEVTILKLLRLNGMEGEIVALICGKPDIPTTAFAAG